jgi:mono/diheme cytochrome c family protein
MPVPELGYNGREGRALFLHYCSTCHGAEGHGDGFNAYNLDPKPRDLADPAFQQGRTDEELATVVRAGGGAAGLSTGMPPWGRTLNDRQVDALVGFLRTLQPRKD